MPLVSQTFDQLLDFTRTTSGTFVGSNGLIQNTPASVNLLTQTQQFDNAAWTKNAVTVTANTTVAPDGTSTADTITESATNDLHAAFQTSTLTALTTHTMSVYVQAGTRSFAMLRVGGGGFTTGPAIKASLTGAGSTTTLEGPVVSSAIIPVGGGWYRVAMTFVSTATTAGYTPQIGPHNNGSAVTYLGDGSGIFIWGAQLEAASAASTYTRNNGGRFPPRFEYDPVTLAAKGLLIEEQRTNLFLRSEEFENASWIKAGATVTANNTTSPDGTVDADKLVEDTSSGGHYVSATAAVTSGTAYTVSVYVKASGRSWVRVVFGAGFTTTNTWFDIANGTVGTIGATSASIQNAGNGWYRITATQSATSSTSGQFFIAAETSGSSTSYTGNGTSGIFIWGAQLEAGAFATSYIPTVASQVTRTADQCSIVAPNFASWYNQSEGTIVADVSPANNGSYALAITDGTANEEIILRYASSGTAAVIRDGGVIQANFGTGVLTGKNALAYKINDFAVSTNGGAAATDTSGTIPTNDQIRLGAARDGTLNINGHIRSIRYYPTRLTNAQLQALTA